MRHNYTQPGGSLRYTRNYGAMRGIDFTNDPLNCDPTRMPMAKNIVVDSKGSVHKRHGYKATQYSLQTVTGYVENAPFDTINGMYVFKPANQDAIMIIHAGKNLYKKTAAGVNFVHITGHDRGRWDYMNDAPSCGFQHKDRFYILDGKNYYTYWFSDEDGQWVLEPAYLWATAPETQIAGYYFAEDYTNENDEPDVRYTWTFGEEGEKNLLTNRRINTFCGDGIHKKFYLDGQNLKVLKVERYSPTTAATTDAGEGTFTNGSAGSNVRDKASMDGAVIGHASANQAFPVLGKSGKWYKIQYSTSVVGFIHESRGTYVNASGGTSITADTDWVTLTLGTDYSVGEVGASGEQAGTESSCKVYNCTKITFLGDAPPAHPRGNGLPNIRVTCVPQENAELDITGADLDSNNKYTLSVFRMPISSTVTVKKNGTTMSSGYNTAFFAYHDHYFLEVVFSSGAVTSTDELKIIYTRESMDGLDTVCSCDKYGKFGEYNFDRYFYTGNTAHRNRDWYSEPDDPLCVLKNSYTDIGDTATPIAGYLNMQSDMLVIKEEGPFECLFRRIAKSDGDIPIFPVKSYQGKGATSRYAMCNINGACLYWTRDGLYEFISSELGTKYGTQNRSWLINDYAKQAEGQYLNRARLFEYNNWVLISFPTGRCYVADTNQQTAPSESGASGYEFFYWENVAIYHAVWFNDKFYFMNSTNDGYVLYEVQFDDYADYYPDGSKHPVDCRFATFCDQMEEPSRYKYIERRGAILQFEKLDQTLGIGVVTDSQNLALRVSAPVDVLPMNDPDLEYLNASRPTTPYYAINRRINRFRYVQFVFRNSNSSTDAFGLLGIEFQYRFGRFVI